MSNGKSPFIWVAIGCGGCLLLVLAMMTACGGFAWLKFGDIIEEAADNPAKAAAMMAVRANKDLELVESDDAAGTLTIRNTKKNETVTLNWEDIKNGKLSVKTDDGEMSIDASSEDGTVTFSGADGDTAVFGAGADAADRPDWIPSYPNSSEISGAFSSTAGGTKQGAYSFTTSEAPGEAIDWFVDKLTGDGFKQTSRMNQGEMVNVSLENEPRNITLTAVRDGGETKMTVHYTEKE